MTLITRFIRLFRADMHAVLDRLEQPAMLLRQAVREMEQEIDHGTRLLNARELEREQVAARLQILQAMLAKAQDELDLCVDADNATLARALVRRRLENERLVKHLELHLARVIKLNVEQGALLEDRRRRLESMRQKAVAFEIESTPPDAATVPDDFAVTEADVELALLRERRKRSRS